MKGIDSANVNDPRPMDDENVVWNKFFEEYNSVTALHFAKSSDLSDQIEYENFQYNDGHCQLKKGGGAKNTDFWEYSGLIESACRLKCNTDDTCDGFEYD